MKRNTQNIILIALLAVFCLCIFAACGGGKADYFTYSESNLGVMGKLVRWMHGWVGNYGWTVVVFTVFLKILMTPLDIWQRVSSRKSTLRMQQMQPLLAEIEKRYGSNSQRANEEKQKLMKKQGFSAFAMCLPMIVSMVIFFVMFGGLRSYSTYSSINNFKSLSGVYFDAYYAELKAAGVDTGELKYTVIIENEETHEKEEVVMTTTFTEKVRAKLGDDAEKFDTNENFLHDNYTENNVSAYLDAIDLLQHNDNLGAAACAGFREAALVKVGEYYKENHESWLWLNNVWQPDTWAPIMPKYDDRNNGFSTNVNMGSFSVDEGRIHYDDIWNAVVKTGGYGKNGSWNGLMLLPFLSVGLSFLSIFLSQRMDRRVRRGDQHPAAAANPQQAASNKVMMIIMPLMMAFFGFMYTGAFAIYMVSNYLLSLLSTVALAYPVEKIVQKSMAKIEQKQNSNKASYMR